MAASDVQSAATTTTFYPAFCFMVSPTHFAWVKMTAAEMRRLKPRKGFEGKLCFSLEYYLCIYIVVFLHSELVRSTTKIAGPLVK